MPSPRGARSDRISTTSSRTFRPESIARKHREWLHLLSLRRPLTSPNTLSSSITDPAKLFLYLLPHALKDGACVHTNAAIAAETDKVDLKEMLLFYAYLI
jgi:hypothetical protein